MAIMLTTTYKKVSSIPLTYGEIRTYARYGSQSIANNETYWQIKCTYYTYQAGGVSFSSGRAGLDGTWKDYGYTTMPYGETTLIEAYRTTKHNTDGSPPTRNLPTAWSATFGGGGSTSVQVTFPKINRYATLTSAPDFNDEQNPTIKYSNPAGNSSAISSLQACIANTDGNVIYVPYRDISKTGTSYTFNLTDAERNALRNATPNSNTMAIKYYVRTIISGTQYGSTSQKTLTITNANPTFTHTELETNSVVSDALGTTSASTIVKNLSKVKTTITPSAKKSATIKKVELTHNGTTYSDTTSPYEFTITPTANKFDVKVTDSRGNVGTGTITKTLLNYEPVKINSFSFKRNNPTGSNIIINLDATYWNTNIGSVTNAPVVKWKMDNGSWNTIPSASVTIDNTNHKIKVTNYTLTNQLVYTSGATFYISVNDAYSSISNNQKVTKGIPVLDLGDNEVQVNGDLYIADTNGNNAINVKDLMRITRLQECVGNGNVSGVYWKLCHISLASHLQGRFVYFRIFIGDGNNGRDDQNAFIDLTLQQGYTGTNNGRFGGSWELHSMKTPFNLNNTNIIVTSDSNLEYDVWFYTSRTYCKPSYTYSVGNGVTITHIGNVTQRETPTGSDTSCIASGTLINGIRVATATLSANVTSPKNAKIPLNSIVSNTSKLTLNNNGIKIGAGISKILVSANVFVQASVTSNYLWTAIRKNSDEVSIAIDNQNTYFASTSHSPRVINVAENDVIYLWKKDTSDGTLRGTENISLTVQVIE